jgi:hypothetical protein
MCELTTCEKSVMRSQPHSIQSLRLLVDSSHYHFTNPMSSSKIHSLRMDSAWTPLSLHGRPMDSAVESPPERKSLKCIHARTPQSRKPSFRSVSRSCATMRRHHEHRYRSPHSGRQSAAVPRRVTGPTTQASPSAHVTRLRGINIWRARSRGP